MTASTFKYNRLLTILTGTYKSDKFRFVLFRAIRVVVICLVVSLLFTFVPLFRQAELNILDFRFKHRPPLVLSERLGTVDIDSATINLAGGWPVSRKLYADLIRCLDRYDVSLVTSDIFFPDPGALNISQGQMAKLAALAEDEGQAENCRNMLAELRKSPDEDFAAALRTSASEVLAQTFSFKTLAYYPDIETIDRLTRVGMEDMSDSARTSLAMADKYSVPYVPPEGRETGLSRAYAVEPPIPELLKNAAGLGFAQMVSVQDVDGTAREYPMFLLYNGRLYPSIGLMGISLLTGVPLSAMKIFPGSHVLLPDARSPELNASGEPVDIKIPVDHYLRMKVNWTGDYLDTFSHIPASAILKFQAEDLLKETIRKYAGNPGELIGRGYDEAVGRVLNRKLIYEAEAGLMGMHLMIAQLAESDQAAGNTSKADFLQALGAGDVEMRKTISDIWDQVSDNTRILDLLRKNEDLTYEDIKSRLAIADVRDDEMRHSTDFLRFIINRGKDLDDWRPLYFSKPITISYEGSSRKTILSPLNLAGKVLYMGLTATATHDFGPIPFNPAYPMVGLHVNAVNTILTRQFIHDVTSWWAVFLIALVCSLPVVFLPQRLHPLTGSAITLLLVGGYFLGSTVLFNRAGVWMPTSQPIIAIALTFFAIVTQNIMSERREKKQLRNAFSTYVTPSIVQQVTADPGLLRLGGQRRLMTAFFSDVEGFTAISEKSEPEELVAMLNDYLDAMTGIIFKHEGTLDKYQGDGIMAFWNAPVAQEDHAYRACCAAIDSIKCIDETLHPRWYAEGKPLFSIRIGINSGAMIVGNMGSNARMDYTIMGDAVNLASRLESANKVYGTRVMTSEFIMEQVRDRIIARELDIIRVIGKDKSVRVYEVICRTKDLDPETKKLIEAYDAALAFYRHGRWQEAADGFAAVLELDPGDGPSKMYLQRCREFILTPPTPGWDGVWTLKTK